jgi:hypothetical protein
MVSERDASAQAVSYQENRMHALRARNMELERALDLLRGTHDAVEDLRACMYCAKVVAGVVADSIIALGSAPPAAADVRET